MKIIERLKQQIESIGGSLDEYDNFICLDAPAGYCWRANGEPTLSIQFRNNAGQSWLSKAIAYESKNLNMGLLKVTDQRRLAEIQHLRDDDEWKPNQRGPYIIEWPTIHTFQIVMPGANKPTDVK
jgi:hypothetical protein